MKDKIAVAYQFDHAESEVIESYYTNKDFDWSNDHLKPLQHSIRQYLRYMQHNKCCYCKQELGFDNQQVDIEHIVPKGKHKTFGFVPKNLALSCHACNSCKGQEEVLENDSVKAYPNISSDFKIVHPYFDDYVQHITIRYPIFTSHTDKGDFTIKTCHLHRLSNVERRQKEWNYKDKLISSILRSGISKKDEAKVFKAIKQIIDQQWPEE